MRLSYLYGKANLQGRLVDIERIVLDDPVKRCCPSCGKLIHHPLYRISRSCFELSLRKSSKKKYALGENPAIIPNRRARVNDEIGK